LPHGRFTLPALTAYIALSRLLVCVLFFFLFFFFFYSFLLPPPSVGIGSKQQ